MRLGHSDWGTETGAQRLEPSESHEIVREDRWGQSLLKHPTLTKTITQIVLKCFLHICCSSSPFCTFLSLIPLFWTVNRYDRHDDVADVSTLKWYDQHDDVGWCSWCLNPQLIWSTQWCSQCLCLIFLNSRKNNPVAIWMNIPKINLFSRLI